MIPAASDGPGALRQASLPLVIPPVDVTPSFPQTAAVLAALADASLACGEDQDGAALPPPLHPAEEVRLTWDAFLGRQAQARLDAAPRIPPAARARLRRIAAWGRAAQERLVVHNLRLVVHWAQRLTARRAGRLAREDLIQAGAIGLMTAARRFDPRRGTRFSTYAVPWIVQSMQRASGAACSIPLPAYLAEEWRHIAAALDESGGDVARAAQAAAQRIAARGTPSARKRAASLTPDALRAAARVRITPASLDAPCGDDPDASPIGALLAAPDASPADLAERRVIAAQVRRMVAALPEEERAAVLLRFFPPDEGAPPSQERRAAALGVSVRRLRTLEQSALARLRAAAAALDLHEALSA